MVSARPDYKCDEPHLFDFHFRHLFIVFHFLRLNALRNSIALFKIFTSRMSLESCFFGLG